MTKKTITILAGMVIVIGIGVGVFVEYEHKAGDEATSSESENSSADLSTKRKRRAAQLAEIAKKRKGLPIDQALSQSKSERQQEFIKKRMAYQRQTPEESLAVVNERLAEIETEIRAETDEKKLSQLKNQKAMLEEMAASFE